MTPPRHPTGQVVLPLDQRVAQLERDMDREEQYGRDHGGKILALEEWRRKVDIYIAKDEAREEMAREARTEAKSAGVWGKVGTGGGIVAVVLEVVRQLLSGG